jgi:hypothetical protein
MYYDDAIKVIGLLTPHDGNYNTPKCPFVSLESEGGYVIIEKEKFLTCVGE